MNRFSSLCTAIAVAVPLGLVPVSAGAVEAGATCDTAGHVTENGSFEFDTTKARTNDPCFLGGAPTVWYQFIAPRDGVVNADLCGSTFDTWLTVYSGDSCPTTCTGKVVENDNACGFQSAVTFNAVAGAKYYFAVSSTTITQFGPGVFNFEFTPTGNTCTVAQVISHNGSFEFDTTGANADNPCYPDGAPVIWYRFQAPRNGWVKADLCGSSFNTRLTVFSGAACPASCDFIVAENDNFCGLQSAVSFATTRGQTYHFAVSGPGAEDFGAGVFTFTFESSEAGEICDEAGLIVANGEYEFSLFGATEDDPCFAGAPTLWYRYVAAVNGTVEADLCSYADFDTRLTVFEGPDCPTGCTNVVAENDNACGLGSAVEFNVVKGRSYYIAVSSTGEDEYGAGILMFEFRKSTTIMLGDLDGNGVVNVADVTMLARLVRAETPVSTEVGDVNGDGFVNEADVAALAQMIVN